MSESEGLFGAGTSKANLLVLFIPSADREGEPIGKSEQRRWVKKALKLLGARLGGATAFPRGWGVWRDDAKDGQLVWDKPVLIQCFTREEDLKEQAQPNRAFLVLMGTETRQGAVGFVIDRAFFEINFPPEDE